MVTINVIDCRIQTCFGVFKDGIHIPSQSRAWVSSVCFATVVGEKLVRLLRRGGIKDNGAQGEFGRIGFRRELR